MKLRWWYGIVVNLILAALVVSGAAFYVVHSRGKSGEAGQSLLVIKDQDSGKVYGKWPLEEGDEFAIEFVHSVNKTPVRDFFRNEGGMIVPFATRFYSLGAGMQSVLEEGGELAIECVQSVNKTPVKDFFRNENGMIAPFATRLYSLGAGMQSVLEEGQTLSRDGDALVITGFTVSFRELYYIVGTVSDHLLEINGETVSLRDLCGRNAHITLRIE
jgi:hypothetical protein